MTITALNSLPTLVTKPGWYITRGGDRVHVHEIKEPPNMGVSTGRGGEVLDVTTFPVKGNIYKFKNEKWKNNSYHIWHVSGRSHILEESDRDIIGVLDD